MHPVSRATVMTPESATLMLTQTVDVQSESDLGTFLPDLVHDNMDDRLSTGTMMV
jgi:hypothetical protein